MTYAERIEAQYDARIAAALDAEANPPVCPEHDEPMIYSEELCDDYCPECAREEAEAASHARAPFSADEIHQWEIAREAERLARPAVSGGFPF